MAFNSFSQDRDTGEPENVEPMSSGRGAPTNKQINRVHVCPVTTTMKRRNTGGREGGRGGAALAAGQTANCLIGSRPPPAPTGLPVSGDPLQEIKKVAT